MRWLFFSTVIVSSCTVRDQPTAESTNATAPMTKVTLMEERPRVKISIPMSIVRDNLGYDLDFVDSILGVGSSTASYTVEGRHLIFTPAIEENRATMRVKTTDTLFTIYFQRRVDQPINYAYKIFTDSIVPLSEITEN